MPATVRKTDTDGGASRGWRPPRPEVVSVGATHHLPLLVVASLIPTSLGLVREQFTLGVGYGLAVALNGAVCLGIARKPLPLRTTLQALGLMAHGLRLATFLFQRHVRRELPKRVRNHEQQEAARTRILDRIHRLPLIAGAASTFALMSSPVLFSTAHPAGDHLHVQWLGVAIQWLGAALAAVADHQKRAYKKAHPAAHWADEGLYAVVRHPNYLGELMVWAGTALAASPSLVSDSERWCTFVGAAAEFVTMLRATHSLEARQMEKYGLQEDYNDYISRTGALLPKLKELREE
jgi:steroid 5-alpha reductase family enzyme